MACLAFLASGSCAKSLNGATGYESIPLMDGAHVKAGWLGDGDLE